LLKNRRNKGLLVSSLRTSSTCRSSIATSDNRELLRIIFVLQAVNGKEGEKMKKGIVLIIAGVVLLASLAACAARRVRSSELVATELPKANMPNPASVYCEQNGNKLEVHTAADGSQSGVCVSPDGSTCDEWAYFRGKCGPAVATTEASGGGPGGSAGTGENGSGGYMPPGTTEEIADWWGVIKSTVPGAEYDDYFERQDLGQIIYFGIESLDSNVQAQIEALRDSGKVVHLYGTLISNVPDFNGSQILVDRIEVAE
jgi:uncharacterized protein